MKDKFFISTFIYKNYLINSKILSILGSFNEFQGHKVNEGHIWDFL